MKNPICIIGSICLNHHFPNARECNDLDIVYDETIFPKLQNGNGIEYFASNRNLGVKWILENCENGFATVDQLYTLKCSHIFWNIHFKKHWQDICFLESRGAKLIPELFDLLYSEWKRIHDNKSYVKLKSEKKDFFKKVVKREFDHDFVHECLKTFDEPMYKKVLKDGEPVLCDEKKFLQLSFDEKLALAREEMYVIAVERYLLTDRTPCYKKAYKRALFDIVTRLSKGWYPKFIVENACVLNEPVIDYLKLFKTRLNESML